MQTLASALRGPRGVPSPSSQEVTESEKRERTYEVEAAADGGRQRGDWSVDGSDRNNKTKQDRMRGEDRDMRRKTAACHFTLRQRNLRRSSRGAERGWRMIGDGRLDETGEERVEVNER